MQSHTASHMGGEGCSAEPVFQKPLLQGKMFPVQPRPNIGLPAIFTVMSPQVTLIPTHDTEVTREWYQQTHEKQQELSIMVLASSSTVVMQDESFPACKIEF